jgi:signal transduction histidine kinase
MRPFLLIALILILFRTSYAQKDIQTSTPNKSLALERANIDRLNKIAHDIFLAYPDSAHKIAANALIRSEKIDYKFGKGRSFLNLGIIYWSQSYYPISLFYIKSALPFLTKKEPFYLSDGYRALGRTYADLKDYTRAMSYLDSSAYYAGNNASALAEVFSERAYIYCALENYDKAIASAKSSLKLNRIAGDEGHVAVLYGRLATIYLNKKDYKAALTYNDTACRLGMKTHNRRLCAYANVEYALANIGIGKYDAAIGYAEKGIALADSLGVIDAETKAYNALIESYKLKNNIRKALDIQKKYISMRDSLNDEGKLKTIKLVQNYYDLNSKMSRIELMEITDRDNKAEIKSQRIQILLLVLSVIVLTVILFATYYFYKQKQLLSNKLQQQHKELLDQKQLIEVQTSNLQTVNGLKDKLLAVIGHDLRAPVANLSNIVQMFGNGYLTAQEVNDLMRDISPIVKGAELTLSNLVEWAGSQIKGRKIESSNVDVFLLGVEMEQTFTHALQVKNISFTNGAFPGQRVLADENHLKVILRNLVSNAVKFTDHGGSIKLTTEIGNNELIVSIEDSGKGMTTEEINKLFYLNTHFSNWGTSGEKGTGIGLLLCKELVELNGGTIHVKSIVGKGSTFYFNLPLMKAYA